MHRVKMYGVTAQCLWEAKVSGGAMRDKTEIRGSYAIVHMCKKRNTHACTQTQVPTHKLAQTYACQEKGENKDISDEDIKIGSDLIRGILIQTQNGNLFIYHTLFIFRHTHTHTL